MDIIKNSEVLKKIGTAKLEIPEKVRTAADTAADAVKEFVTDKVMTKVFHKEHQSPKNIYLKVIAASVIAWEWIRTTAKGIAYTVTHPQWPEFVAAGILGASIGCFVSSFFSKTMKKLRWVFGLAAGIAVAIVVVRAILRPRD